jgi:hypothetical protein
VVTTGPYYIQLQTVKHSRVHKVGASAICLEAIALCLTRSRAAGYLRGNLSVMQHEREREIECQPQRRDCSCTSCATATFLAASLQIDPARDRLTQT